MPTGAGAGRERMEVVVRPAAAADLGTIGEILAAGMVDPGSGRSLDGEVSVRLAEVAGSIEDGSGCFLVAVDDLSAVVGVIGLQAEGIDPALRRAGERPVELVSAYVERASQGTGVGSALSDAAEALAASRGFATLLVVSGSRNRAAHRFWQHRYGEPIRFDAHHFGTGQERVVWRSPLATRSGGPGAPA